MRMRGAALLRVFDDETHPRPRQLAGVADLAARLCVERRAIEHDFTLLASAQFLDGLPILQQRDDVALRVEPFVSLEQRARVDARAREVDLELASLLRPLALLFHR